MRNVTGLVSVLVLVLALGGCGHRHVWTEATCTQPRTCLEDGVTEGEALGHDWKMATCTQPKTCARCGATEGEALGHDWRMASCTRPETCARCGATKGEALGHQPVDADYWTPSLCSVCGEELGPVLPPDFAAVYGFEVNMEPGEIYELAVPCENDPSKYTVGKVQITRSEVHSALEGYACGNGTIWNLEGQEGFEWRTAAFEIRFDDENSLDYGVSGFGWFTGDYYHLEDEPPEEERRQITDYGDVITSDLVYKGADYEMVTVFNGGWGQWDYLDNSITGYADAAFLVPSGYDGCIFGPFDFSLEIPAGHGWPSIAGSNWLFFRLA